jgi:hypothetical protein
LDQEAGASEGAVNFFPDAIAPVSRELNYAREFTVELDPYMVAVVEIRTA